MKRALPLSYTPRKTLRKNFQLEQISNSATFPKQPDPTGRSTDHRHRSIVPNRELGTFSRSTGQSTATTLCTLVHNGRPACCCCYCWISEKIIIDFLDFLSSSYNSPPRWRFLKSEPKWNIRTIDSKVAAPVWLPTYPTQGNKPFVVHPKEL